MEHYNSVLGTSPLDTLHNNDANFKRKLKLYGIDIVAALGSAFAVAPIVKIIDRVVTQKASWPSMDMLHTTANHFKNFALQPVNFLCSRQFAAICIVYGGTYTAANTITTYCEEHSKDSFYSTLFGTAAVNMFLGIKKDKFFAQSFSRKSSPTMPMASWGLFIIRDVLTVGSGFSFPPMFSAYMQERGMIRSKESAEKVSQLVIPMAMQACLAPVHLLALDTYNRAGRTAMDRLQAVRSIYFETATMRMGRVLAAYGICGVTNKSIRKDLRQAWM